MKTRWLFLAALGFCLLHSTHVVAQTSKTVRLLTEARGRPGGFCSLNLGSGLRVTTEGRIFVLQRRTDRAIGGTREQIGHVECAIKSLEREVTTKRTTCGQLCTQIEGRKHTIEGNRERSRRVGLIGALFGAPVVACAGLIQMYDNDALLRDLNTRLTTVRAEQRQIENKVATYEQSKTALDTRLGQLRTAEQKLVSDIAALKVSLASQPASLQHARLRLDTSRSLLGNLRCQVQTLDTIHSSAAALGISLDGHLQYLKGELGHAERLVESSTRSYLDLLAKMVVRGPEGGARQWLTGRVRREVSAGLQQAGLGAEAVQYLARRFIPSQRNRAEFVERVSSPFPEHHLSTGLE